MTLPALIRTKTTVNLPQKAPKDPKPTRVMICKPSGWNLGVVRYPTQSVAEYNLSYFVFLCLLWLLLLVDQWLKEAQNAQKGIITVSVKWLTLLDNGEVASVTKSGK